MEIPVGPCRCIARASQGAQGIGQLASATQTASGTAPPIVCSGPRDLIVANSMTIDQTATYDRVCVLEGGDLSFGRPLPGGGLWRVGGLSGTLTVGSLYVAAGGTIS